MLYPCLNASAQNYSVVEASTNGGPKYPIHQTDDTKTITVNNLDYIRLGDCRDGHFVVTDGSTKKAMIFDNTGKQTGELEIRRGLPIFSEGVALTYLPDNKCVIIGYDGNVLKVLGDDFGSMIKPGFYKRAPDKFVDGLAVIQDNQQKFHFIDTKGNILSPTLGIHQDCIGSEDIFSPISPRPLVNGRRAYKDLANGLYGYINEKCEVVIPARFLNALDFSDGLAAVMIKDDNVEKWGFIDTAGNVVINPIYSYKPGDFHEGFATVSKKTGKIVYINKKGEVVSDEYDFAGCFTGGYAVVNHPRSSTALRVIDHDFSVVKELTHAFRFSLNEISFRRDSYLPNNDMIYRGIEGGTFSPTLEWLYTRTGPFYEDVTYYHIRSNFSRTEEKGYINRQGEIVVRFIESEF